VMKKFVWLRQQISPNRSDESRFALSSAA